MKTLALLLASALVVGTIGKQIAVPNRVGSIKGGDAFEAKAGIVHRQHRTADGLRLHYRLVPAAQRAMRYRYQRNGNRVTFEFDMQRPAPEPVATRGSIVYLHGWGNNGQAMVPWAMALADHGWQGVVLDLRGHGESGSAPAGYGTREAADVTELMTALQASGELPGPVFVFGNSYGAVTALFAEQALRGRVSGIIAMQPFATARGAIGGFIEMLRQSDASTLSERLQRRALRNVDMDAAIDDANRRLALDLRMVDVRPAVAASATCLLFVHADKDGVFPLADTQAMAASTPMGVMATVPGEHHLTLPMRIDWLATALQDWVQATAARGSSACPQFTLPAAPVPD